MLGAKGQTPTDVMMTRLFAGTAAWAATADTAGGGCELKPTGPRRTFRDSTVQMTEIVLPEDSNPKGTIFGGRVLALIDKCAAIVAMRHARTDVVTASLDTVSFLNKVRVGDVLMLDGRINAAFGSSMEIEVRVRSEDPLTGETRLTTTAYVTMVAVDGEGCPLSVEQLASTGADDVSRAGRAAERRRSRLAARE